MPPAPPGSEVTRELSGWGRTSPSAAHVVRPAWIGEVEELDWSRPRGTIARGLGRSYGDAAQNAGGTVVEGTAMRRFDLDEGRGLVTAEAGASLDDLLGVLVPRGFFVPVTPGTRLVTVGGAVAADIHGKNHHLDGSWCDHVEGLDLLLPSGEVREVTPRDDPDLFWATAGGMGLTGIITRVTFRCPRIETSALSVDTDRFPDLDGLLAEMEAGDADHHFSVAWIDLVAGGRSTGRSVLTRGRFATTAELEGDAARDPLAYDPRPLVAAPPWAPSGLLNRLTVRAFNELWFRRAPRQRHGEIQSIAQFFHPLDLVEGWNRLYGPRGFLQWQVLVPFGAEAVLRSIVERLSAYRTPSFLAVLKRFGPGNDGPLSFPAAGWTLALDVPTGATGLGPLLDELDLEVAACGGRLYLAKDSRMDPRLLPIMYPRLDEWRAVRERVDPHRRLRSDLGRRLGL